MPEHTHTNDPRHPDRLLCNAKVTDGDDLYVDYRSSYEKFYTVDCPGCRAVAGLDAPDGQEALIDFYRSIADDQAWEWETFEPMEDDDTEAGI